MRPAAAGGGRGRRARAREKEKKECKEREPRAFTGACRAVRDGASVPRRDLWCDRARPRHRSLPRWQPGRAAMHGAVEWFDRAMSVGVSKSDSFEKKTMSILKIVLKRC